jgi:hypothetical protein
MGVITGAHGGTTHGWANAHMALSASFPEFDIAMVQITHLTDGGITGLSDQADLTGGHTDLSKISLFS